VVAAIVVGVLAGAVVLVVAAVVMMVTSRGPLAAAVAGMRGSSSAEVAGV
jgi:putative peptidoglycan lipid II flippase